MFEKNLNLKECRICQRVLNIQFFSIKTFEEDGFNSACKKCLKKERRENNEMEKQKIRYWRKHPNAPKQDEQIRLRIKRLEKNVERLISDINRDVSEGRYTRQDLRDLRDLREAEKYG